MDIDPTSILGKRKRNIPLTFEEMQQMLWMIADRIDDCNDRVNFIMLEEAELLEKLNEELEFKLNKPKRAKGNKKTYWLDDPLNPDNIFGDAEDIDGITEILEASGSLDEDTASTEDYTSPPPASSPSTPPDRDWEKGR